MNRRDFMKALAGIPLLGLLVKLLKVAEPTLAETYIKDVVNAESQPITLIIGDASHPVEDEIITLKSSDFVPTADGFADTDTFGTFVKSACPPIFDDQEPFTHEVYEARGNYGNLIFWDPTIVKGDDDNDGYGAETPVASLQRAIDLADSSPITGGVITFYQ